MSKFDTRNNTSDEVSDSQDNISMIKKEVKKLFDTPSGNVNYRKLDKLRSRYSQKVVDEIYDKYTNQLQKIRKRAKNFASKIYEKYPHVPTSELFRKALKYKKKYNLSDSEFKEFKRLYEKELFGHESKIDKTKNNLPPLTKIGKTLGIKSFVPSENDRLNIDAKDNEVLQKVIDLHSSSKLLHSQVITQSVTYRDCAIEALTGQLYDNKNMVNNPANHVHPILAAMFLPKIKILDEHMLFGNISKIIQMKHQRVPDNQWSRPDFDLYYDLVTDPNDIVCNVESPLRDLYHRCVLQNTIWENVLNLRTGLYYKPNVEQFLNAVDNCRMNMYDTPDLMYVKDEGTIFRRLLSAFSFRPTIVSTIPMNQLLYEYKSNAYNAYVRPSIGMNLTPIPMITLRLPYYPVTVDSGAQINLEDALNQEHWYLENKSIVPKQQTIVHSSGVIFFYVYRRQQSINFAKLSRPYNFNKLPLTLTGVEKINTRPIHFKKHLDIMNDKFRLRSVVLADVSNDKNMKDVIIGNSTLLVKYKDHNINIDEDTYLLYDPIGASFTSTTTRYFGQNKTPISWLFEQKPFGDNSKNEEFYEKASTKGTIFIYQKMRDEQGDFLDDQY